MMARIKMNTISMITGIHIGLNTQSHEISTCPDVFIMANKITRTVAAAIPKADGVSFLCVM